MISIRFSHSEAASVRSEAKRRGLTVSEFIRRLCACAVAKQEPSAQRCSYSRCRSEGVGYFAAEGEWPRWEMCDEHANLVEEHNWHPGVWHREERT